MGIDGEVVAITGTSGGMGRAVLGDVKSNIAIAF